MYFQKYDSLESGKLLAREMALLLAEGCNGWASWGRAGEFPWVVMMREIRHAVQLSYDPVPESGLWVGFSKHPPYLGTVGTFDGNESPDTKLQNIHNTGQKLDIQEELQRDPITGPVAEPEQWLMVMNTYK